MGNLVLLDGKLVDANEINAEKHRFIGMFRTPEQPNMNHIDKDGKITLSDVYLCRCGADLWSSTGIFNHWKLGHMDKPQYITIKNK